MRPKPVLDSRQAARPGPRQPHLGSCTTRRNFISDPVHLKRRVFRRGGQTGLSRSPFPALERAWVMAAICWRRGCIQLEAPSLHHGLYGALPRPDHCRISVAVTLHTAERKVPVRRAATQQVWSGDRLHSMQACWGVPILACRSRGAPLALTLSHTTATGQGRASQGTWKQEGGFERERQIST